MAMKTIVSRDNPTIKRLHGLATTSRERRKQGETLLDGPHLVAAALAANWPLKALYVSESGLGGEEIRALVDMLSPSLPCTLLPDTLFAHISPVDSPSGLLALVDLPESPDVGRLEGSLVVLDGIQDPGNLGAILRTAAAAGIGDALLADGCAQAWAPRVLRAGMGAHFLLRIREDVDVPAVLAGYSGRVLATALDAQAQPLYALDLRGPTAWLFGAEGRGLSAALLARADARVAIPMPGAVESLNVAAAAAVCLFEQLRQRLPR